MLIPIIGMDDHHDIVGARRGLAKFPAKSIVIGFFSQLDGHGPHQGERLDHRPQADGLRQTLPDLLGVSAL